MNAQPRIKLYVLSGIGFILLIVTLSWVWHYLHTGQIIITTNSPYKTISLSVVGNKTSKNFKAPGKLAVTVSLGQYVASVEGNSQATTQLINLNSHKTLRYEIDPIDTTGVEPVAYQNAQSLIVNDSSLVYLDASNGYLSKIDAQNNTVVLNSKTTLKTVRWASSSFGVGQDNDGHLYNIINGSISPLNVPFSYGGAAVSFDVSRNKQIYVSYGAGVYGGNQSGNFKKIYTATSSEPVLAAGAGGVAVAVGPSDVRDKQKPLLSIVAATGKVTKKNIATSRLAWSPNGKYLLDETRSNIYDSSLRRIVTLPTNSFIGSADWLDNSTLFYSVNEQLWVYNLTSQKAKLIANMPLAGSITGLAVSSDKSYVYVTTAGSNSSYAIRRVGLKGQQVPNYIYSLQDILPITLSDSWLGLVNFAGGPTILVESFPNSNLSGQVYLQEAQNELKQDGFDLGKLQFKFVPGS